MKNNYVSIILIFLIMLFGANLITCAKDNDKNKKKEQKMDFESINKYKAKWNELKEFEKNRRPQSALDVAYEIFTESKTNNDVFNTIKSLLYVMEYRIQQPNATKPLCDITVPESLAENPSLYQDLILAMEIEALACESNDDIFKSTLFYLSGHLYEKHLEAAFHDISGNNTAETSEYNVDDVKFWSVRQYHDKIMQLYSKSLEQNIKTVSSIDIQPLLAEFSNHLSEYYISKLSKCAPTMYDIISYAVLNYFNNNRIRQHTQCFDKTMFASNTDFVKITIKTDDDWLSVINPLKILQDLTAFHIQAKNDVACEYVAVERYKYLLDKYQCADINNCKEKMLQNLFDNAKKDTIMYGIIVSMFAEHYLTKNVKDEKYTPKLMSKILEEALTNCPENSDGYHNCKRFLENLQLPSFNLESDAVLIPDKHSLMHVSYCNMDKVYFNVYKVDKDFCTNPEYYANSKKFVWKIIDSQKAVVSWTQDLYDDKEYRKFSSDIAFKPLPVGHYLIVASDKQDIYNKSQRENDIHLFFTKVTVTHFAIIERQVENYKERNLYVVDRETGLPIPNVEVVAKFRDSSRRNEVIDTFHTDKNGYVHVDYTKYLKKPKDDKSFGQKLISVFKSDDGLFEQINYRGTSFELTLGEDNIIAGDNIYRHFYDNNYNDPRNIYTTEFMFDRAIYRPGQKVFFKAILYNQKEKVVVPNKQFTISVRDVNNQVVFTTKVQSNKFGSASGEFVIPTDRLNGFYSIRNDSYYGYKQFQVEEYKRPKFEVKFNPTKGILKLGQEISATGVATSFSGVPLQNATVSYEIKRNQCIPYWSIWNINENEEVIADGTVTTDNDGVFEIKFVADGRYISDEVGYNFNIQANVTDINGETQRAQTNIRIGGIALELNCYIPDMIYKESDLKFKIVATNTEGVELPNKGSITISKLKTPETYKYSTNYQNVNHQLLDEKTYRELFPHLSYNNEHLPQNMAVEKKCLSIKYDTGATTELDLSELKKLDIGQYKIEFSTQDQFGKQIDITKYFVLSDDGQKLPFASIGYQQCNKTSVSPGEKVVFDIGASANIHVLVEKERQSKIISSQLFDWNERKKFVFDIEQEDCGGVDFHFTYILDGKFYNYSQHIYVDYNTKKLAFAIKTMRKVMEPSEKGSVELIVKDYKGQNVSAEIVATMYDASLNAFAKNYWGFDPFDYYYGHNINGYYFDKAKFEKINIMRTPYYETCYIDLPSLKWNPYRFIVPLINFRMYDNSRMFGRGFGGAMFSKSANMAMSDTMCEASESMAFREEEQLASNGMMMNDSNTNTEEVYIRKNLAETAFFYPELVTNDSGEVAVKFTMPDSLTTWDFMAFAHTPDLARAFVHDEIVSRKTVMVTTNIMRFLREQDKAVLSAKISNISEQAIDGIAEIQLFDATTNKALDIVTSKKQLPIKLSSKGQTNVQWSIDVPDGVAGITYRIIAKAGQHSDGEEATVPVLPRRILVTESITLSTKKQESKNYSFEKLVNLDKNSSIATQNLTVEYTANPAWTALMSLPYLVEYPYDCMEQTFSKIYGNALALHLIKNNPEIAEMIKNDKSESQSMLEKNEDLKNVLLAESPWLLDAKREKQTFKDVKNFLNYNKVETQIQKLISILEKGQLSNGGWSWFIGGNDNYWITFHIIKEYGHLKKLGVSFGNNQSRFDNMIKKAVYYCDDKLSKEYKFIKKNDPDYLKCNHLPGFGVDYLYMRSFFANLPIRLTDKQAYNYFLDQAHTYWNTLGVVNEAKLLQVLHRKKDALSQKLLVALKEQGVSDDEFGFYWQDISGMSKASAIEAQALMVETFCEVEPNFDKIKDMQVWMLKQKQTNDWYTTKATTNAIYALLLNNIQSVTVRNNVDISLGNKVVSTMQADNPSGYIRQDFVADTVTPEMGEITLTNHSDNLSWGGVFWQYYNDIDKIATNGNAQMRISKQYIVSSASGKVKSQNEVINVGDIVTVRLRITSDREYSFVHIKDLRPACLEPMDFHSGYVFDKLIYYKNIKDASMNFFIDNLSKGAFVIDYKMRVTNPGTYLSGISTIQCMYAPEFSSHSDGGRMEVK